MPTLHGIIYRIKSLISPVQVIGYPKSGNTWLRVTITKGVIKAFNLRDRNKYYSDFHIFPPYIPNIIWSHGTRHRRALVGPDNLDPHVNNQRKTILLVRDPRDVLVSFYHHELYRNGPQRYIGQEWRAMFPGHSDPSEGEPTISQYIRSPIRGIDFVTYFMNFWLSKSEDFRQVMLVRYEDILDNPRRETTRVFQFLGLPTHDSIIDFAIEESKFDKMREMEISGRTPDADLAKPKDINDLRTFKTRVGKAGGYLDVLNKTDLEFVNEIMKNNLDSTFGYTD